MAVVLLKRPSFGDRLLWRGQQRFCWTPSEQIPDSASSASLRWIHNFHIEGVSALEEDPGQSIRIDAYIDLLKDSGWEITHIIDCPMSTQRFHALMVSQMQKNRILGVVRRSLIIGKKKCSLHRKNRGVMAQHWIGKQGGLNTWRSRVVKPFRPRSSS